ncbi:MAG: hypothetical protein ACFFDO_00125 [Candidatus Thorarchaeota archaeon]
MKDRVKFIPIIVMLAIYVLVFLQALNVVYAQNDGSYIILGLLAPLPLLIGIFIATIKLIKEK